MTVKPILIHPNAILTTRAEEVHHVAGEKLSKELLGFIADMKETLIASSGVGLAANQVGDLRRVILLNANYCAEVDGANLVPLKGIVALVNPVITIVDETLVPHREGCLSIPHVFTDVERPSSVRVDYIDEKGTVQHFTTQAGLFNAAVQHEVDHLDGIMFPDQLRAFQRRRAWKKLEKERKNLAETLNYAFTP